MKTILSVLLLLFVVNFISNKNALHAQETTFKTAEDVEETYFMHGIQISKRFCYLAHPDICESGEVVESDTLRTSFLVLVTFETDRPDSVLFDGLEGANTKPREMISNGFNGGAATASDFLCRPSRDCGYARKTGTELKFDLLTPNGHYFGSGTLDNDILTIQANYYYRGSGAEYILEGQKIVEEK